MTEALNNHEQHERKEAPLDSPEELKAPLRHEVTGKYVDEADPRLRAEQARHEVEQTAPRDNPLERVEAANKADAPVAPSTVNRELKSITLRRELKSLQRKESLPQRTLSKVIHQPVVRVVSEVASNTVSRPSGLLGGGLMALIGTTSYLILAEHNGYTYNYMIFLLLFIGGFIVGLVLELLVRLATASRRSE